MRTCALPLVKFQAPPLRPASCAAARHYELSLPACRGCAFTVYKLRQCASTLLHFFSAPADVAAGLLLSAKLQKMLPKRLVSCVPVEAKGEFSDGGVGAAWDGVVTLGLQLNDQGAWALLERGPHSHDSAAAAEFKAMWGDVVETRQFRDGSVMECVPWCYVP